MTTESKLARRLEGAAVAAQIRRELQPRVAAFAAAAGRPPALGVVLVGDNPASRVYVRNKCRAAEEIGIRAHVEHLPAAATLAEALAAVSRVNQADEFDGLLVQFPLPAAMGTAAAARIFDAIDPLKDVDGFTPANVGLLVQQRVRLAACTPLGILELLDRSSIPIAGRHAVVIGRSEIVGKPVALLLLHRDATVTVCHSKTPEAAAIARTADLLVVAIGRPGFVTGRFVKPGATVVDVGINRLDQAADVQRFYGPDSPRHAELERRGSILIGDVHPEVEEIAGALTPVPGGVGPLTVAMLLSNTVRAAEGRRQLIRG